MPKSKGNKRAPYACVCSTDGVGSFALLGIVPRKAKYDLHVLVIRLTEGIRDGYSSPRLSEPEMQQLVRLQHGPKDVGAVTAELPVAAAWELFVKPAVARTPSDAIPADAIPEIRFFEQFARPDVAATLGGLCWAPSQGELAASASVDDLMELMELGTAWMREGVIDQMESEFFANQYMHQHWYLNAANKAALGLPSHGWCNPMQMALRMAQDSALLEQLVLMVHHTYTLYSLSGDIDRAELWRAERSRMMRAAAASPFLSCVRKNTQAAIEGETRVGFIPSDQMLTFGRDTASEEQLLNLMQILRVQATHVPQLQWAGEHQQRLTTLHKISSLVLSSLLPAAISQFFMHCQKVVSGLCRAGPVDDDLCVDISRALLPQLCSQMHVGGSPCTDEEAVLEQCARIPNASSPAATEVCHLLCEGFHRMVQATADMDAEAQQLSLASFMCLFTNKVLHAVPEWADEQIVGLSAAQLQSHLDIEVPAGDYQGVIRLLVPRWFSLVETPSGSSRLVLAADTAAKLAAPSSKILSQLGAASLAHGLRTETKEIGVVLNILSSQAPLLALELWVQLHSAGECSRAKRQAKHNSFQARNEFRAIARCVVCNKTAGEVDRAALQRCNACVLNVRYCGRECQAKHWPVHKDECKANRK